MDLPPFPFDPAAAVRFLDSCWFSHDGQWFLKAKDRFGLEVAMEMNEAAVHSMGKIEARRVKELTGITEINDCIEFARFMKTFWAIRGISESAGAILTVDEDTLSFAWPTCLIHEMAKAAEMAHMGVGNLPGCRGFRSRIRGWAMVLSQKYDFMDEELAGEGGSGYICRHRIVRKLRTSEGDDAHGH